MNILYGVPGEGMGHATSQGNVYLSGVTTSSLSQSMASPGAHQTLLGGSQNGFLAKFDGNGVRLWGTYYGGGSSEVNAVCTSPTGDIYLSGTTKTSTGTVITTAGAHQSTFGGSTYDAFLAKFDANGVRLWGTYYGGSGNDYGTSCATDAAGNVYMCGVTRSSDSGVIATSGVHQVSGPAGLFDGYLVKFNASGVRQWGTYFGGPDEEYIMSCITRSNGDVFISGRTTSTLGISTPGAWQSVYGGGSADALLAGFNSNGICQWATYYGGPDSEFGRSVCADTQGNIFMAGYSNSTVSLLASSGSHQNASGGKEDGILVKFEECTLPGTPVAGPDQSMCQAHTVTLTATTNTGSVRWYESAGTATALGTGTTYVAGGLSAGIHTLYAGAFTCGPSLTRAAVTVTVHATPTIVVNSGSICAGESFTITPGGADTYTFINGGAIISPSATSSYSIIGTSLQGCESDSAGVSHVIVNLPPVVSVNSGTICSGEIFTLSPSGALTYSYTGGSSTVSPGSTTSYTISGSSAEGCTATAVAAVMVNPTPTVSVNSGSICPGDSFTIQPSGAAGYTFSSGASVVSPVATSIYTVIAGSVENCTSTAISTVWVDITPTISVNSGTICTGDAFILSPSGAFSYTYSSGSATLLPVNNATYYITGSSALGCAASNTAVSTVWVNITPTISVNSGTICAGDPFIITPSGAFSYTYSGGTATVLPVSHATYYITGSSTTGCLASNTAIATVVVNNLPDILVSSSSNTICAMESATLTATGGQSYTWSPGGNTGNNVVSPVTNTSYTLTGTGTNGCSKTVIFTQYVDVCAGTEKWGHETGLRIFPNPFSEKVFIEMTGAQGDLQVLDATGRLIVSFEAAERIELDLRHLTQGIYFLRTAQTSRKIVKE
jgi:hypothetical protein